MNALRMGMFAGSLAAAAACAGDVSSGPSEPGEASDALRAEDRSNPCALVRCKSGFVCQVSGGIPACVPEELSPKDPSKIECKTDADCRLHADYCEGCNCLALGPRERPPMCEGEEVACLLWPCQGLAAVCDEGECVVDAAR